MWAELMTYTLGRDLLTSDFRNKIIVICKITWYLNLKKALLKCQTVIQSVFMIIFNQEMDYTTIINHIAFMVF